MVPRIFSRAAELETPRERMVQIVRWYLSSFHASRKSAVAKKPYNPILGEVFQCWWNLDNDSDQAGNAEINKDGPVPWCNNSTLVFIAEQVSHHPPSVYALVKFKLIFRMYEASERGRRNLNNFFYFL